MTASNVDAALDETVATLRAHADEWVALPIDEKVRLLEAVRTRVGDNGQEWVDLSVAGKGIDPSSPWVGEEWISGPWALAAAIDSYLTTLADLSKGRKPQPESTRTRPDGQLVARVYPRSVFDRLLMNGITADVWMQRGVTEANLADTMAVAYDDHDRKGGVAVVLGGGNINSIPALDVLYELIADQRVALLKLNPVNDYLAPVLRKVFAPLIDRGFVAVESGGVEVGSYLTHHSGVDKIHITGSARSHDAIVYGPGPEGAERKRRDEPALDKEITSELGGVGPVIVVPGPWSDADLSYQALDIATMKLHNTGANCIAAQVLVLPAEWAPHRTLLTRVREQLHKIPPRSVYYPGTPERLADLREQYPAAEAFGVGKELRCLVTGLDAAADEYAFREEFFAPALAQTTLPGATPKEFLRNAIDFANNRLAGTLGATILVHPKTKRELGDDFDDLVAELRYGAIGVNIWNAAAFLLAEATWGAYPGHPRTDIQSGTGVVHNGLLFDRAEKTVVTGPFAPFPRSLRDRQLTIAPTPPWFVTNKTADKTGRLIAQFAVAPGWRKLPAIFASALRG